MISEGFDKLFQAIIFSCGSFLDAVANVLLWKNWFGSAALLIGSTALWLLFERAGYNLLLVISNVLLLLVVMLFFWAKSALFLNR